MHWARKCRCAGPEPDLLEWCGHPATEEDGLCTRCREVCVPLEGAVVLTMEQARHRDLLDSDMLHD